MQLLALSRLWWEQMNPKRGGSPTIPPNVSRTKKMHFNIRLEKNVKCEPNGFFVWVCIWTNEQYEYYIGHVQYDLHIILTHKQRTFTTKQSIFVAFSIDLRTYVLEYLYEQMHFLVEYLNEQMHFYCIFTDQYIKCL